MSAIPARLKNAAGEAVENIGPVRLRAVADRVAAGFAGEIDGCEGLPGEVAAAYLHGVAAGYERHRAEVRVEPVWSGPASHAVPVRRTSSALNRLIAEAEHELLLMTYSAKPHRPLLDALAEAVGRGVAVTAVVETLQGAGSALSGAEPAAAFASVRGIDLWHWPRGRRTEEGAKMHAKLAVADRGVLFVSSANLTHGGIDGNIEAGLLVRGGTTPQRVVDHVAALRASGILERLR